MSVALVIAGLCCAGLAGGHALIGVVWVLPRLPEARLPATPFGPPVMTEGMLRVTWHVVTVFCLALGAVLITLAWGWSAEPRALQLRSVGSAFLVITAVAFGVTRPRPRSLLRLPVWSVWLLIAVLCWTASA